MNACEASLLHAKRDIFVHASRVTVWGRHPALLSCFFKSRANVPVRERPSGFAAGKAAQRQAIVATATKIAAAGGREAAKRQGFN